ncbi:20981_t:CDS:1, partial [Gigaspora rosea]
LEKNSTDMQWSIDLQLERDVLVHVIMDQYGSVYLSGQWKLKKINPDDQCNRDVTVTSL